MSRQTIRAYLTLCPDKLRENNSGNKGLRNFYSDFSYPVKENDALKLPLLETINKGQLSIAEEACVRSVFYEYENNGCFVECNNEVLLLCSHSM